MNNSADVVAKINIYFSHFDNSNSNIGFAKKTVIGRLIDGDVINGSEFCSHIPAGIYMTDSEYIRCINSVDCALVALKSIDLVNASRLWDYIHGRYRLRLSIADLMVCFNISKRTCFNRQKQALLFIYNEIS